jgi:hypothetical protein
MQKTRTLGYQEIRVSQRHGDGLTPACEIDTRNKDHIKNVCCERAETSPP